jgi:hypothetical protein
MSVSGIPHIMTEAEDRKPEAAASSSIEEPSKSQRVYYAIRTCDSLKAPAVFFSWDDCFFYIDQKETEGKVVHQGFDVILDAVEWIHKTTDNERTSKLASMR